MINLLFNFEEIKFKTKLHQKQALENVQKTFSLIAQSTKKLPNLKGYGPKSLILKAWIRKRKELLMSPEWFIQIFVKFLTKKNFLVLIKGEIIFCQ